MESGSLLGAAAIAAVLFGQSAGSSANIVDPLFGAIPGSRDAPETFYRTLRAEPRDASWAPKAEQLLRARFEQVPHVGRPPAVLRVTCGSRLCEVAGTIDAPVLKGAAADDPKSAMAVAMRELQSTDIFNDLKDAGLLRTSAMFGGTPQGQSYFMIYYTRQEG